MSADLATTIATNLARIRGDMADACRRAGRQLDAVRLIAVTKQQDPAVLPILAELGVCDVGENRIEHHSQMRSAHPDGLRWHAIGRVQGRQLRKLLPITDCLHSLHDLGHVDRLVAACRDLNRQLPVMIQVNTAGEAVKAGLEPQDLPVMLERLHAADDAVTVRGLMTMAPNITLPDYTPDDARRCFAALRALAEAHALPQLSMGMSNDLAIAIEEGATDVRIGTDLFRPISA